MLWQKIKKGLDTEEMKKAFKVLNINIVLCMNWKKTLDPSVYT